MVKVRWLDGAVMAAPDWETLLAAVRRQQVRTWRTERGFRKALARRALVWSGTEIDHRGTARQFCHELQRAQFFGILEDVEERSPRNDVAGKE